nr:PTS sugar transporter subunit IIA [Acetatifactor sp.]
MRITDLLDKNSISLNAAPADKKETLDLAVELMAKSGKLSDVEKYREQVYAREEESTTGIGEGIAIPHGKCDAVKAPGLAAMVIKNGVEYESLDGEPVTLLFLIAAPNTKDNVHLDVLSKLSVMLMDENFTTSLRNAKSVDEFLQIIDAADESAKSIDDRLSDTGITTEKKKGFKLLAVTSCPTGIAHTYMAAEALEKAARAADCQIKIETRGSAGAKNVLTAEEIEAADCIIVAADAKVPMDRFNGKKVISCQVSDGIGKADQLVKQAMSGNVEVFHGESSETTTAVTGKESAAHKIYTQLMNGVSHMLPFVVGGGILIAIAFLIDGLNVDINALPADQRSNFGTITPIAAMFKNIGGV